MALPWITGLGIQANTRRSMNCIPTARVLSSFFTPLRMSMKEGVWVMLATAAPRLIRRMKGSTRRLQADSQEPAGMVPFPATQLQLV